MSLFVRDWLRGLEQHAEANSLEHLDIVIDATGLDYPLLPQLAELEPRPQQALLFDGTPEQAQAAEGPVLVRLLWAQPQQVAWLGDFLAQFGRDSRLLALLSHWPFEPLTDHLRYCTQAQWDNGAHHGILRYYDTRLFKLVCDLFMGDDSRNFHAPIISWHWIDRDQRSQVVGGDQRKLHDYKRPQAPLMLDKRQMESISAWSEAEQWEDTHGAIKRNYSIGKEQRLVQIYLGQLAADEKQLKGAERNAFMVEWLAQHLPETLPPRDSSV